jgi:hypothetical protein
VASPRRCPADKVTGKGYDAVHAFADTLPVGPRTYGFQGDDTDRVVFCFANPTDADLFRERYNGERVS